MAPLHSSPVIERAVEAYGAPLPADWIAFGVCLVVAGLFVGWCADIYTDIWGPDDE